MSLIKHQRGAMWPTDVWPDERFDRAFRDMFRDFFTSGSMLDRFSEGWSNPMHVEEYVENDTCVIRAELPGFDAEKDIDISMTDGILHLRAHREERKEEDRPSGYRSEFRYGGFARSIRLPEGATEADVKASYKDGILEVRIPTQKVEKTETRIPVEHE